MKDLSRILGVSLGAQSNKPKYLVIHCSDISYRTQPDQFLSINEYHRDVRGFPMSMLGWNGGYHYLYTGGKEYIYRNEDEVGAHCNQGFDGLKVYPPGTNGQLSMNYQSIGLCIGFNGDIEMPPAIEYSLLQTRVWRLQEKYNITNDKVFFHRKFNTDKTCPGSLTSSQWMADLLRRPAPVPTVPKENSCATESTTIATQKGIIANLRDLVDSLINYNRKNIMGSNNRRFGAFSSWENPDELATTVKGVILGLGTLIIWAAATVFHITLTADNIIELATQLSAVSASIAVAYGLCKKLTIWAIEEWQSRKVI